MKAESVNELILQALEHELGGVNDYGRAIECAINDDLREEWEKYLAETLTHVEILTAVCGEFGLDPDPQIPARVVVRSFGKALVDAMDLAAETGNPEAAQLVACECVDMAETKDHLNWELLGKCADKLTGPRAGVLRGARDQVEDQEDEHLYHSKGWCRELWIKSLGMKAVLPPPEEKHHVKTAIGASRAGQASAKSR